MTGTNYYKQENAADDYAQHFKKSTELQDTTKRLMSDIRQYHPTIITKTDVLLDLGCGVGFSSQMVVKGFGISSCVLVDSSNEMIGYVNKNSSELFAPDVQIKTVLSDLSCDKLDLPAQSIHIAMSLEAMKFLDGMGNVFKQTSRVLVPNYMFYGNVYLHEQGTMKSFPYGDQLTGEVHSLRQFNSFVDSFGFDILKMKKNARIVDTCEVPIIQYDFVLRKK